VIIENSSNGVSLNNGFEGKQAEKRRLTVDSVTNWQLPLLAILFVTVVFVAIKTVVHRHESRTSFMQMQKLEKERDKLAAQWSRLKLEQGAMLNQVRVERLARWDLKMNMPKASKTRIVREPTKAGALPIAKSPAKASLISKVALSD
jgi:cell division protein FtsL